MFPLCDLCFQGLNSLEIIQYANALVNAWARGSDDCSGMSLDEVRRNVAQAVRFLKGEIDKPPFKAHWPQRTI